MKMKVSGKTQLYGVIGDPIEHSLSPAMHNAAFEALKLDCVFLAFKVGLSQVEDTLRGMRSLGIRGLNVTMPDKNAVISYLNEVNEIAKFLGSVNTILNDDGRLLGFSTDGEGASRALKEYGISLSGKKLLLLGGGGAAKAIAYTLSQELEELTLLNRTPEKTNALVDGLKKLGRKVSNGPLSESTIEDSLKDADILINATNVGMLPVERSLLKSEWLRPDLTVMDIVYNPLETKLAKDAKEAGAKVISGLEMLIYQGAASFEIWTGKPAPVEVMRKAAESQLSGARR